jgi:thymidylate kinase
LRVIALTGCDGSGKSTLAAKLVAHLREQGPTEPLYLGQSSGRIGEWIHTLPIIGAPFGRYLVRKSERVHEKPSAPPGNVTALAIYLLSRWRAHKFRRMLAMCRRGVLVITDRYPQAEMPGFLFDGPQLAKTNNGNWWVRKLRAHEQRLYEWMAASVPLLVIRLNVDAETAHARKPDHKLAALREKIAGWPHLRFNGARILDLDAREEASTILDTSLRVARAALQSSQA